MTVYTVGIDGFETGKDCFALRFSRMAGGTFGPLVGAFESKARIPVVVKLFRRPARGRMTAFTGYITGMIGPAFRYELPLVGVLMAGGTSGPYSGKHQCTGTV